MASALYGTGSNPYDLSMRATVSEKGQVTIPKPLRDRLGIQPGQVLDFDEEEGRLVARKIGERDPVDAVYGILHLDKPTDEFLAELRGDSGSE
jgi:antitoxin PrlF